jgi:hypothetical protein
LYQYCKPKKLLVSEPSAYQQGENHNHADGAEEEAYQRDVSGNIGGGSISSAVDYGKGGLLAVDIHVINARLVFGDGKLQRHGGAPAHFAGPGLHDLPVYLQRGGIAAGIIAAVGHIGKDGNRLVYRCLVWLDVKVFNRQPGRLG